jgi:lysophospholipase L1-like esterase
MSGTIVCIGDSITDCDRRSDPCGLGGGYVDFIAAALRERGDDTTIVNTGVSGDRVEHLQERWQSDALDHRPTVLSIYIGVNDTLVTFFQGRPTPPEEFERRYTDILDRTAAAGITKLIIVEPFYVDCLWDAMHWHEGNAFMHEDLGLKRPIVRRLAERYGAAFVPLQSAVDEAVKERGPAVVASDGVHPSAFGSALIARLWLSAYDSLPS